MAFMTDGDGRKQNKLCSLVDLQLKEDVTYYSKDDGMSEFKRCRRASRKPCANRTGRGKG